MKEKAREVSVDGGGAHASAAGPIVVVLEAVVVVDAVVAEWGWSLWRMMWMEPRCVQEEQ